MKLALAACFLGLPVSAFLPILTQRPSTKTCRFGSGDDYDDWYADFDPSQYEASERVGNSVDGDAGWNKQRSGPGGGGGGRRPSSYSGSPRRSSSFSSSGHGYERDTSRDSSNIDEDTVNQLLSDRVAAKKRRDFDTADAIRDQLLQDFAVGVFDKERTWRTGCSASGSGMGRRGNAPTNSRRPPKQREFGPQGHDYRQSPDAGPVTSQFTQTEIDDLLAERLQAKLNRDFNLADDIQAQLISSGVYVNDARKEWRADGVPFGDVARSDGRPGRMAGSRSDRNRPYQKSLYSAESGDESYIDSMVQERAKCKELRDFDRADSILQELANKFNVQIDDRIREWSVGGDFGRENNVKRQMSESFRQRGYAKSTTSRDLSKLDEDYVAARLEERSIAKQNRDFDMADQIREELEGLDVVINDKLKLWSVGGDFSGDGGPSKKGGRKDKFEYTRRGGGGLTDDEVAEISDLIAQRAEAKKNRDFAVADDIRSEVRERFNVAIDDANREWHVDSDEYVESPMSTGNHNLTPEQINEISAKLAERFACKLSRDYDRADDIRDELAEVYGVEIDDRTKEWSCVPKDGASDDDRDFAAQAASSQSSAFKRTLPERELESELDSILDGDGSFEDNVDDHASLTETEADLSSLKVVELKEKLRVAGLPVSGTKAELIDRLLSADTEAN